MSIKLLALDLDGTIFGDDLLISDRSRKAIRDAQLIGVIVTIATGRTFGSARQVAADLDIAAPLICYQGAMVRHSATEEMLYHKTVPLDDTHRVIEETYRLGLHLNVYVHDRLYVDHTSRHALFYSRINMGMPINEVGDLHAWLQAQGGAEPTKLVIVTDEEDTDHTLSSFTEMFAERLQVTKSHPRFTELTNSECSKGRALAFLANYCGIERDEVMAIGDGHNDLDMIAWAGCGVAMATSPQAVLDVARIVCSSLKDEGAADSIERYILQAAYLP